MRTTVVPWILLFAPISISTNAPFIENELATNHVGEIPRQEGQPRLLSLTNGGEITGELLITLPLTLLLPTVAMDKDYQPDRLDMRHYDNHQDELWRLLRIPSDACRRKVLCEMAKDPHRFEPISGVFYLSLRNNESDSSALWESSSDVSFDCASHFPECPQQTNAMLDFRMLRILQKLSRKLAIKIVDS